MSDAKCPSINGVVETVLYVEHMEPAIEFYRDVLGLTPMAGDPPRFQPFD